MKSVFALSLIATLGWTSSAFALNQFFCQASLRTKTTTKAPALVMYTKALRSSQYDKKAVTLTFKPEVLAREGAYVILDGRGQMIDMNVHVDMKQTRQGVKVTLTDRISQKSTAFTLAGHVASVSLSSSAATFDYTCAAQ